MMMYGDKARSRLIRRGDIVAALDIGSSKICCFLARYENTHLENEDPAAANNTLRVIGVGHHASRGIKAGTVIDMDAAEKAVRGAVDRATRMAGVQVKNAIANVSCGAPASESFCHHTALPDREITDTDIRRTIHRCKDKIEFDDRIIIHTAAPVFSVDNNPGIRDPRGMYGRDLEVRINTVSATTGPVRNLAVMLERCRLNVLGLVSTSLASGLSCLVEDELELGVVCIDMGGGLTTIGGYTGGELLYTDVIPLGGNHVTSDIAHGLNTTLMEAERLKTMHGSAIVMRSEGPILMEVSNLGETNNTTRTQVPSSLLSSIIIPRLEELFELIKTRSEAQGFTDLIARRVVLTGGASSLGGISELAARVLGAQVRIASPHKIWGLAQDTAGPAFSTCAGLLNYGTRFGIPSVSTGMETKQGKNKKTLTKWGEWIKETF